MAMVDDSPVTVGVEVAKCVQCFRKIRNEHYRVRENDGIRHLTCWRKKRLQEALLPMKFSFPKFDWSGRGLATQPSVEEPQNATGDQLSRKK